MPSAIAENDPLLPSLRARTARPPRRRRQPGPRVQGGRRVAALHPPRLGRAHRGRGRQRVHRLRDVVGAAHPRACAARPREGAGRRRARRHELRRAEPARSGPRRARPRADAVDRAGAVRQLRHRSDDERGARGAGGHRPRPHPQVRRVLSRPRGRLPREGRLRRADARHADQPRRDARPRRPTRWSPATTIWSRCSGCSTPTAAEIAAVIVEPIAGNMGVVPPADGFLRGLRELCSSHGALLIFDEVISGFRAAAGGAQAIAGVRPDLTCLGKIIGGGLPVGAYGGRADLMELVSPSGPVYQAGTLVGQPAGDDRGTVVPGPAVAEAVRVARRAGRPPRGRPRRCRARRRRRAAGQRVRFGADAVLHRSRRSAISRRPPAPNTRHYSTFFRGMLTRGVYPPPSQFEAWFLSAAHTVAGRRQDDQGGASGDEGRGT